MKLTLGPVLYLDRCEPRTWRFRLQVLVEGAAAVEGPPLAVRSDDDGVQIGEPSVVADFSDVFDGRVWRWPFGVRRDEAERQVGYRLEALPGLDVEGLELPRVVDRVAVPALGQLPRLVFFSCNGVSEVVDPSSIPDLHALWKQIYRRHVGLRGESEPPLAAPFHLLLGGGDQVYADRLWFDIPEFLEFSRKSPDEKLKTTPSEGFYPTLLRGYVETYAENWGSPAVAAMLARLPGLYTWDDHDIFDNWGSYGDELGRCEFYQTVYRAAERTFQAFQLGGDDVPLCMGGGGHFLQAAGFHEPQAHVDVLSLDLRSGRGYERVLAPAQWSDLERWLERHAAAAGPRRHLLIVSSIPLVYMRFDAMDRLLEGLPDDYNLQGDLRDQWEHPAHREERNRLLLRLLEHGRQADCAITLLSGDVHIGGHGCIVSNRPEHLRPGRDEARIEQLISSGIVHPAPDRLESSLVELAGADAPEAVADGVVTRLLPAAPEEPYLWTRNWLALSFDVPSKAGGPCLRGRLLTEDGPQAEFCVEP